LLLLTSVSCPSPAQQNSAPSDAGSEGGHQDQSAFLEPTRAHTLVDTNRDGSRGRIADTADVRVNLFRGKSQPLPDCLGDALVCLVWYKEVDLVCANLRLLHDPPRHLFQIANRRLE